MFTILIWYKDLARKGGETSTAVTKNLSRIHLIHVAMLAMRLKNQSSQNTDQTHFKQFSLAFGSAICQYSNAAQNNIIIPPCKCVVHQILFARDEQLTTLFRHHSSRLVKNQELILRPSPIFTPSTLAESQSWLLWRAYPRAWLGPSLKLILVR